MDEKIKVELLGEIKVEFLGGESRIGRESVNYMLAKYTDESGENEELYSEVKVSDYTDEEHFDINAFDEYSYPILKADIIEQAKRKGIDINRLEFYWG